MSRAGRVAGALTVTLLLGAGGYAAADAYDVVPGLVTLEPVPAPAAPFPTAPGAVPAPDVDPVVPALDPAAPGPGATEVTALARDLVADPRLGTSTGVVVTDVLSGEVLADVDGATPRVPASTAKMLGALAAITALGPERTLDTTVVQPEPGRLVLVGGGDMMLTAGAGQPDAVVGRAGLVDLAAETARELRLAGVSQVALELDDTLFSGPAIHPAWDPSDVADGFVAAVAPLGIDIAKIRPGEYPPRYPDPALQTAQTFAQLLTEQGIAVAGAPTRAAAPADALELARVESAPVREIVRYAVQVSDNTITEVLGRLVAIEHGLPGSFEGATSAVVAELGRQGLPTQGAVLADCSGLAAGSALPAALLTGLVAAAADPANPKLLPVLVDLPVSGWQGTLAERFGAGPARGLVRAKTGSLPNVTSLAGTVQTSSGRLLAFAVLAEATPRGQTAPRAAIDGFVQQLAVLP
ncbi:MULTISPECIES: D-alanyl-D-alanine carboxypeptidase/D-alanyl-D-alanine-endopeptidase [unclassified Actinotalea]|uniref:D-alanyl-D-alanine carboxypeptidase/D-alanyl-D-alanine endopeptidase n=1 Tax=unclassified Actinotalea TaxID=2638618 RepID=UPI0015F54FCF|nr:MULTISPECIES: D-alanyl-D-alanine carboxypeptidase/D-alanyl-D-alanine-endopeptidase [unclassified Actinotalea]